VNDRILCAAIWYKDLPTQAHLPRNIQKGVVVCGWRHGNCIGVMSALGNLRSVTNGERAAGKNVQGFLTQSGRFVNRRMAAQIAFTAGQTKELKFMLFSEDIY
jgi:hypothetical protein